jgi:hypothetical protein
MLGTPIKSPGAHYPGLDSFVACVRSARSDLHTVHAESIVDANRPHLNVIFTGSESVPSKNRDGGRNSEGSAAQTEIIILGPYRPIVGKSPFKAATDQPTTDGVAAASTDRCSSRHVGDVKLLAPTQPPPPLT